MGRLGEAALRRRGRDTARALERLGLDVDLAPVADVPAVEGSFISRQRRGFSTIPMRVAKSVTAFSAGLLDGGIAPTLKHFPGLGLATKTTDRVAVAIDADAAALEPGLVPYRRAIAAGVVPLVMVSNASYAAYGARPAAWSPAVLRLLRGLGFRGATITDALEALATTQRVSLAEAAIRAARAGVDLLLFVGSERSTERVYRRAPRRSTRRSPPAGRARAKRGSHRRAHRDVRGLDSVDVSPEGGCRERGALRPERVPGRAPAAAASAPRSGSCSSSGRRARERRSRHGRSGRCRASSTSTRCSRGRRPSRGSSGSPRTRSRRGCAGSSSACARSAWRAACEASSRPRRPASCSRRRSTRTRRPSRST